nr:PREDICTED: uncharacterized protein LOC108952324 [Musa acuminata subsp. malaccensis]
MECETFRPFVRARREETGISPISSTASVDRSLRREPSPRRTDGRDEPPLARRKRTPILDRIIARVAPTVPSLPMGASNPHPTWLFMSSWGQQFGAEDSTMGRSYFREGSRNTGSPVETCREREAVHA